MKTLITGTEEQRSSLKKIIPDGFGYDETHSLMGFELNQYDFVFDLDLDNQPELVHHYVDAENLTLICSAVKLSLSELSVIGELSEKINLVGINALPGFINRPVVELSFYNSASESAFAQLNEHLKWDIEKVKDRVGMASPRVIFMIINEACYTLQEGTSDISSIDQAMKLGTNYPKGPFEWADAIGINHVYETLLAMYEDTGDPRYKICPLLKEKYLKGKSFYA